jgi:hypothetical protein
VARDWREWQDSCQCVRLDRLRGRPLFTPSFDDNNLPTRSQGDPLGEGYSGYVLVGLALMADDNIANYGTTSQTQVVVCRAGNDPAARGSARSVPLPAIGRGEP